jgi:hypothetical protein
VLPTYGNAHSTPLIQLCGYSPPPEVRRLHRQRCASRQRQPPRGFFTFSAQRRYIFTATLYISPPTTPPHSVRPPHLRNCARRHLPTPASSGLSIHGGGPGESGSCRCREGGAPRIDNLSQALQHTLETYTKHTAIQSLWRLISTSPADLSGLSQRVEREAQLLLKTFCQPASCRALPCVLRLNRCSPVSCANCPLDGMDCCCLLLLCFVLCIQY